MAFLLRDKREELDKQISMLEKRGNRRFLYSSMRLYGRVDAKLLGLADALLNKVQPGQDEQRSARSVGASEFLEAADAVLRDYQVAYPGFYNHAEVRPDMSGLLVSEGNLLIGHDLLLSPCLLY